SPTAAPATAASATRFSSLALSITGSTWGTRCTPTLSSKLTGVPGSSRLTDTYDLATVAVNLDNARETLLAGLREHALVIGQVTLSSGQRAEYYVDAKRALLRPAAYRAAGELVAAEAADRGAAAVGGMTMGADPLACAAIGAEAGGGVGGFFVRKERKEHGLPRSRT